MPDAPSKTPHPDAHIDVPTLPTRVGRAGWSEHWVRGAPVFAEVLPSDAVWDLWNRMVAGPPLDPTTRAVLDAMATAGAAADPRIPPMKILRLLASYGGELPALGALVVAQQDAWIGAWTPSRAASDLVDLRHAALADSDTPSADLPSKEALETVLRGWLEAGRRPAGFGVPAREQDERFVAFERRMEALGRAQEPYFRLLRDVGRILVRLRGLPPNIAAGGGAAALDIGFSPRQIGVICTACGLPSFAGNALEGAIQRPEILQRLPPETVRYVGHAPRQSPRATAKTSA